MQLDKETNLNLIMIVDDEPGVLNALRRLLKTRPCHYGQLTYPLEVETFDSPAAALVRAKEGGIDLVLTDYMMPQMDGVEFLKQFRVLQPDAARIVLSGMADLDDVMRAITEVDTSRFLPKPWNDSLLLATIAEALTFRSLQLESRERQP
jgi:response regulator RpfG family c-di-GMP phosphodiesterase